MSNHATTISNTDCNNHTIYLNTSNNQQLYPQIIDTPFQFQTNHISDTVQTISVPSDISTIKIEFIANNHQNIKPFISNIKNNVCSFLNKIKNTNLKRKWKNVYNLLFSMEDNEIELRAKIGFFVGISMGIFSSVILSRAGMIRSKSDVLGYSFFVCPTITLAITTISTISSIGLPFLIPLCGIGFFFSALVYSANRSKIN